MWGRARRTSGAANPSANRTPSGSDRARPACADQPRHRQHQEPDRRGDRRPGQRVVPGERLDGRHVRPAEELDRDRDGPAPREVRPQESLDPADRVGPPGRVEGIEGRDGHHAPDGQGPRPPTAPVEGRPRQQRDRQEPAGELRVGRPAGEDPEDDDPSPARMGPPRPGRVRRRRGGDRRLGEGEDRPDPEARQRTVGRGVVPVAEELRLEHPGPRPQRGGPGAEPPGQRRINGARDQREGEDRPDPGARQGLPAGGEQVARQAEDRVEGGVAVRLLAAERPEPVHGTGAEQLGAGVDLGGLRRPRAVGLDELDGGRAPGRGEACRVLEGPNPGSNARLAAERVALVPDDRQAGRRGEHQGQGRDDDQDGPGGEFPSSREAGGVRGRGGHAGGDGIAPGGCPRRWFCLLFPHQESDLPGAVSSSEPGPSSARRAPLPSGVRPPGGRGSRRNMGWIVVLVQGLGRCPFAGLAIPHPPFRAPPRGKAGPEMPTPGRRPGIRRAGPEPSDAGPNILIMPAEGGTGEGRSAPMLPPCDRASNRAVLLCEKPHGYCQAGPAPFARSRGSAIPLRHDRGADRPMRVTIVTETYAPQVNGVSRTLGHLVRYLASTGDTVQVIHPDYGEREGPRDGRSRRPSRPIGRPAVLQGAPPTPAPVRRGEACLR